MNLKAFFGAIGFEHPLLLGLFCKMSISGINLPESIAFVALVGYMALKRILEQKKIIEHNVEFEKRVEDRLNEQARLVKSDVDQITSELTVVKQKVSAQSMGNMLKPR